MELFRHNQYTFSMRCRVLALWIILAHLSSLASAACNSMVVFKGDEVVTDSVCKQEYLTNDCRNFTSTYDISFLPEDEMRGPSVQGPGRLDIMPTMTSYSVNSEKLHFPTLHCSWKSPSSDTAKKSINGFYMWVQSDDMEQTECRIFSIDHSKYAYDQLRFEYDFEKISEAKGRNYTVRIYSLPMPDRQTVIGDWMRNRDNYKAKLVTTKNPFTTNLTHVQYPAHWSSGLTVEPNLEERSIDVWFSLPDPSLHFNFTHFTVGLVDIVSDAYNPTVPDVTVEVDPTSNATRGHHRFTGLSPATWYQVYVHTKDQYPMVEKKCHCYYEIHTFIGTIQYCERSCRFSRSAIFDLKGDVTTKPRGQTHAPPVSTDLITSPSLTTDHITSSGTSLSEESTSHSSDKTTLISSIIGGVVGFVVTIILIVVICRKCPNQKPTIDQERDRSGRFTPMFPNLRRKTVFLLYSSDHEYHLEMMKKFKIFLQTHCKCNVKDISEFDDDQNKSLWLSDKFSKCDLIIFFDSPGAYRRLVEYRSKQYYSKDSGLHGDLFNLGLHYICDEIINNRRSDKAIIVSLSEERCKEFLLGVLKEWVLPRDLSPFLLQLHGISAPMMIAYKSQLPMVHEFKPELPCVPDLLQSIEDVKTFEKQNPDWFSTHFELITRPKIERIVSSDDSTYGSMNGSEHRSITPPLGSSTNTSPISDNNDYPSFPNEDIDDESCRVTVVTDPPVLWDGYAGNGDEFSPLTYGNGNNEWSSHKVHDSTTMPEKKELVPPVNMSKINTENTSIAIGDFNHKMIQSDACGSLNTSKEIVPPCNKSEIMVDNLSMAIGGQNHILDGSTSDMSARDIIKPPIDLSDLNFENCSLALGQSNQKNVFEAVGGTNSSQFPPTKNLNGNKKVLNPPRDELPLGDKSDSFSEVLSSSNSDFTNNIDNAPLSSKRKIMDGINDNHPRYNPKMDTIRPPVDKIPVEKLDNFSEVLNCDMNRNDFSRTVAEDKREKQRMHFPILPPVSDISSEDSISCALQNVNTKSKEDFMSSKQNNNVSFV